MRVATLNVHFWSKENKLNSDALIQELKSQLSNMDIVALQEVTFGQKVNQPLVIFDKSPKTTILYNGQQYKILIDESSKGRLENSIREQLGFPLSFKFSLKKINGIYNVTPINIIEDCWLTSYQTLDNTILSLIQKTFQLPYCVFNGTQNPNFGNAILSKHSFADLKLVRLQGLNNNNSWSLRSAISIVINTAVPIQIITTHLDHLSEAQRVSQLQELVQLIPVISQMPQILLGDFNCLTQQDYTESQVQEINASRAKNNIELAKFDVINLLNDAGWLDCAWNGPKPVFEGTSTPTSRFDTRIDYIFTNRVFINCIDNYRVFPMNETDHNGIFVQFYPVFRTVE